MTKQEFERLLGYEYARRHAPRCGKVSKRSAKSGLHLSQGAIIRGNAIPKGVYPLITPSSKL